MSTWCRDPCGDPSRQAPVDQESDSSSGLIWVRVEGLAARTRCRSEVTVTINSRRVWARRDGQGPRLPERAGSSPGAPHRGGGLPPSKPGLVAGTHDLESSIRNGPPDRESLSIS